MSFGVSDTLIKAVGIVKTRSYKSHMLYYFYQHKCK